MQVVNVHTFNCRKVTAKAVASTSKFTVLIAAHWKVIIKYLYPFFVILLYSNKLLRELYIFLTPRNKLCIYMYT